MGTQPLNVILVEDDGIDAEAIERGFRAMKSPPHFTVCQTARAALDVLRNSQPTQLIYPTVVLLDLNLPGMSGLEFLRLVRQDAQLRGLVVFVVSDSHDTTDKTAAYDFSVAGYLSKSRLGRNCENLVHLVDVYMQTVTMPAYRPA